jgi:drug/metabolite transporter (DMT)-like permease
MESTWLAVLLALASALIGALGTVLQQTSAAAADQHGLRLLRAMITHPRWLLGYALGVVAVAVSAGALTIGALLVVQPVGVTSLLFALPLAARFYGVRMTTQQWVNAGILTTGLAVFVAVGRPTQGDPAQPLSSWLLVVGPMLALVVAVGLYGRSQRGHRRALALATATGVLFGIQAALTKAVLDIATSGGLQVLATIASWELYALVVMAVASVALQQVAFQAADLSASQPAITVLTPIAGAICGILIFGERLETSSWGLVAALVASVAMAWATVSLARTAGTNPAIRPPMTTRASAPTAARDALE